MSDIAQLGFSVDTGDLTSAKAALESLPPSARKVEDSAKRTGDELSKLDKTAGKTGQTVKTSGADYRSASSEVDRLAVSATRLTPALNSAAHGATVNSLTIRELLVVTRELAAGNFTRLAGSASILGPQLVNLSASGLGLSAVFKGVAKQFGLTKTVIVESLGVYGELAVADAAAAEASRASIAAMAARAEKNILAADTELALAEAQLRLAATGTEAAAAQLRLAAANAAVAAASGEAAVAEEALSIANEQAAVTGAAAAEAQVTRLTLFGSLLRAAGIGAVVFGTVFAVALANTRDAVGTLTDGMDLTDKQLQKLKDDGVDLDVTWTDMWKGLGRTITQEGNKAFKSLGDSWANLTHELGVDLYAFLELFVGGWGASIDAVGEGFRQLPAIARGVWDEIKGLMTVRSGNDHGPSGPSVGEKNIKASMMAIYNAGKGGYKRSTDGLGDIANEFVSNTGDAGRERVNDASGSPGKTPKGRKGPKTDAEKFADIVRGAENDIAKEQAKADALGLTAEATATLEEKTKLLNEAHTKGIALTDGMRGKIDQLAAAYGKAKVEADNAKALHETLKSGDADLANLQTQIDLVGKYGHALAYATEMAKLLAEMKAKNATPEAIAAAAPLLQSKAEKFAGASDTLDTKRFLEGAANKASADQAALGQQVAALNLTGAALASYAYEQQILNGATAQHINLSERDKAAIHATATAYGELKDKTDEYIDKINFAKETVKGFFTEFTAGIEQGKSLWQAFGDAAVNALNKIINKLLDNVLNNVINAIAQNASSGGGFASGGAFNSQGVTGFASGGAFTNSVVSSPTLFAFANGGALGVMGEAGPEAVMPLHRGSDGSLGVRMSDGGSKGGAGAIHVQIDNHNILSGAVSSADVIALNRQAAEQTRNSLRQELPTMLAQYNRDGAFAS